MGFYDELKQTSINNYCPPKVPAQFPYKGYDANVQWVAYETVSKIKKQLKDDVSKKIFYKYRYRTIYSEIITIGPEVSNSPKQLCFNSWETAQAYFVFIKNALNAERIQTEWHIDIETYEFNHFLSALYELLFCKWSAWEQQITKENQDFEKFPTSVEIRIEAFINCDIYGRIL